MDSFLGCISSYGNLRISTAILLDVLHFQALKKTVLHFVAKFSVARFIYCGNMIHNLIQTKFEM